MPWRTAPLDRQFSPGKLIRYQPLRLLTGYQCRLLTDLLEDDLAEVTYDAELAGLDYSVTNYRGGILVSVNGYNDKLGALLDTILLRLKTLVIEPARLKVMTEQVRLIS